MADQPSSEPRPLDAGDRPLFPDPPSQPQPRPLFPDGSPPAAQPAAGTPGGTGAPVVRRPGSPPAGAATQGRPPAPVRGAPPPGPPPPPLSSTGTPVAGVRTSALIGSVTARVAVQQEPVTFTGATAVLGTCVLAIVVLLVSMVLGRLSVASTFTALGPPVVVLVGVVAARRGKRSTAAPATTVTARRFDVQTGTGELVACVAYGDFAQGELRPGDLVRIPRRWPGGRKPRIVRHIALLYTLSGPEIGRLDARLPARVSAIRLASRLCVAAAVILALWTGFFLVHG